MAAFKVNITKNGNAIKFQFTDSDHYLYGNGEIEVPVNSLSLVIDESDFVTFKKASTNDTFITFNPANSNLADKAGVIEFYKTNMVGSTGGGGSESGITSGDVQTMIDNSLEDYYTDDEVDAALSGKASISDVTAVANDVQTVSGQVATKVAITDFNTYSAATDSRLAEDEEVTAAALNDLQENKADTSAVTAVASDVETLSATVETKQDALEYYSEAETEDSETGEIDKYGQIEVADELNGAHIYADYLSTNEEKSPYASIDAWVNDGEGNEKQNRVYADADGVGISADENADDGEGNIVHTTSNVSVSSTEIGMNVGEEGDTTTTLSITSTGVTINGDAVATEPYVDAATSGKADTSAVTAVNDALTAHTADTGIHVSAQEKNAWNAKAEPYSAGTGIEISGNVISATGGGGATYSAGTNISIDTGNTINCTLNARNGTGANSLIIGNKYSEVYGSYSLGIGERVTVGTGKSSSLAVGLQSSAFGSNAQAMGRNVVSNNDFEHSTGRFNNSTRTNTTFGNSGNTLLSVGNGHYQNGAHNHNAFEIRQNGDLYFADTDNTTYQNFYEKPMVRLQDMYGALGGLKLVKLTQSEYDQLATKDPDTLYIITNVVS